MKIWDKRVRNDSSWGFQRKEGVTENSKESYRITNGKFAKIPKSLHVERGSSEFNGEDFGYLTETERKRKDKRRLAMSIDERDGKTENI